jgi:GNAT superfamily N-acetyltransferase
MKFQISEESVATLSEQAEVSIAFDYDHMLELTIVRNGLGGFVLEERRLSVPRTKDYDAVHEDRPSSWSQRFDVSNWGFIVARSEGQRIGGAVVAFDTNTVGMLEGRRDLSVLWDIRIAPTFRGKGVGASLFKATEKWSAERGCHQLKIETQNTNLSACRFYLRQGCTLGAINRLAYPDLPDEIQMIWYKHIYG